MRIVSWAALAVGLILIALFAGIMNSFIGGTLWGNRGCESGVVIQAMSPNQFTVEGQALSDAELDRFLQAQADEGIACITAILGEDATLGDFDTLQAKEDATGIRIRIEFAE